MLYRKGLYFAPESGAGGSGGNSDDPKPGEKPGVAIGGEAEVLDWETWHKALPGNAQALITSHVSGLKTALGSEREARKTAEKDLRSVAKKLEEGSEAQQEVLKLADAVAEGATRADFYEDAHEAGVSNIKLAYHVATTEKLFDKRGNVDFVKMKEQFPELFGKKPIPKAHGGEGTGSVLDGQKKGMNLFIRTAAGKR